MLVAALVVAMLGLTSASAFAVPVASPSATDLSFTDPPGGGPGPTQAVVLTNSGDEPLHVTGGAVATGDGFSADDGCKNEDVLPTLTCTINVAFSATDEAPVAGTLTITTNGPGDVKLTLRGNAPRVGVDTTPQSFTAAAGATSAAKQITLTNTGLATLTGTTPIIVGPNFTVRSTTCGDPLAPAASCTADITFTPTAVSAGYTALLRFSTNDPVSPVVNIPLNGSGTAGAGPGPGPGPTTPTPGVPDSDGDEVVDGVDFCPIVPGNLKNGCPSELNAQVIGRWRTNRLYSKLISLSVRATTGSKIELRCSGDRKKCGFTKRTITATTRRVTSLTRFFKGSRILSAGTSISVRVTRPLQVGTYKRLVTRSGRRLPKVTEGCLSARTGAVGPCA